MKIPFILFTLLLSLLLWWCCCCTPQALNSIQPLPYFAFMDFNLNLIRNRNESDNVIFLYLPMEECMCWNPALDKTFVLFLIFSKSKSLCEIDDWNLQIWVLLWWFPFASVERTLWLSLGNRRFLWSCIPWLYILKYIARPEGMSASSCSYYLLCCDVCFWN